MIPLVPHGSPSTASYFSTYPYRDPLNNSPFLGSQHGPVGHIDGGYIGHPNTRTVRTTILTTMREEPPINTTRSPLDRVNSERSENSGESYDITMDDDDDRAQAGSDIESNNESDSTRPTKKKKGQKFFCKDYPPCNLGFTRSEHLARHIRKHTGERPFQCHCQRRFTRLDNLRQHAQTVHSNEDIPGDSLAAIGTRFQRQIRTDRVRTSVSRPRPSSLTSQNNGDNHGFNHSRTLSNSSFGSSAPFDLHPSDDPRRRPVSLTAAVVPAFDPSGTQNGPPYQFGSHLYTQSPDGYSTPNSIYSANSIQVTPDQSAANPALSNRPSTWGGRIPSRRLSSGLTQQHDYISSAPYSSSTASYMTSVASNTPTTRASNPSSYISPAPPGFTSPPSIYFQSCNPEPDLEQRRRTWHPSTWRRPPSGLSYSQTPDVPTHVPATPPTVGGMRLPGIDSFDLAGAQPLAPPRRAPSPMDLDEPSIAEVQPSLGSGPSRPPLVAQENSWDLMHNNLHKLDLTRAPPAKVAPAIMAHQQSHHPPISVSPAQQECVRSGAGMPVERPPAESISEDVAMTPRNRKRQAWYNGPLHASAASHGVESHRINGHPTSGGQATPTFAPPPPALVPYRPASSLSSATTEGYITSGTQRYSASTQASSFEDWRAKMSQSAVSSIR